MDNKEINNTIEEGIHPLGLQQSDNYGSINNNNDNTNDNTNDDSNVIDINNNEIKKTMGSINSSNLNKKISVLSDLKYLTNNICKNQQDFKIDDLLQIHIDNNIYTLITINNLSIDNTISISDIYISIMEKFLKDNDFNIIVTYKDNNNNENYNKCFFGSIPILDETSNQIIFYNDYNSINNYLKALNKTIDKKVLESYTKLEKLCEIKKKTHSMASKHYACYNKYFVIPSILLSSASGIISFLASTTYFDDQKTIFSITVGVAASVNTLFQSFASTFDFATKAEAHQNATETYDQLLTQIRFEKMTPNKKPEDFIDTIEQQILDTKQRCKYMIPDSIENTYNENKFNNYKEETMRDLLKKFIDLKTDLYYDSLKDTNDYSDINFKNVEKDLGFDDIKDHDIECCSSNRNKCCFS